MNYQTHIILWINSNFSTVNYVMHWRVWCVVTESESDRAVNNPNPIQGATRNDTVLYGALQLTSTVIAVLGWQSQFSL